MQALPLFIMEIVVSPGLSVLILVVNDNKKRSSEL